MHSFDIDRCTWLNRECTYFRSWYSFMAHVQFSYVVSCAGVFLAYCFRNDLRNVACTLSHEYVRDTACTKLIKINIMSTL